MPRAFCYRVETGWSSTHETARSVGVVVLLVGGTLLLIVLPAAISAWRVRRAWRAGRRSRLAINVGFLIALTTGILPAYTTGPLSALWWAPLAIASLQLVVDAKLSNPKRPA